MGELSVINFTAETSEETIFPILPKENKFLHPHKRFVYLLKCLGAKTCIITQDIMDDECTNDAVYYKKMGKNICFPFRMDFFSLCSDEINKFGGVKAFLNRDEAQLHYLGYIILRNDGTIFSSIIKNPFENKDHYLTCSCEFPTIIAGNEFKISGFPFYQKSPNAGVMCAEACLKTVVKYLNAKFKGLYNGLPIEKIECNEIVKKYRKLLREKGDPTKSTNGGLTTSCIKEIIKAEGYELLFSSDVRNGTVEESSNYPHFTELIDNKRCFDFIKSCSERNFKKNLDTMKMKKICQDIHAFSINRAISAFYRAAETVYFAIESAIPPIICLHLPEKDEKKSPGHSIVGVGHIFEPQNWWPEADRSYYQKIFIKDYTPTSMWGEYISSVAWVSPIIGDDNFGPYLSMWPSKNVWIKDVIVPVPEFIKCYPDPIFTIVSLILQYKSEILENTKNKLENSCIKKFVKHLNENKLVIRPFLISPKEFLSKYPECTIKKFYETAIHSREIILVAEISYPELFLDKKRVGEIVVDILKSASEHVIGFHVPFYFSPKKTLNVDDFPKYPYGCFLRK